MTKCKTCEGYGSKPIYIENEMRTKVDTCPDCHGTGSVDEPKQEILEQVEKIMTEMLAEFAHKQWSGWMKHLFSKCTITEDGVAIIPRWAVDRWARQMNTPYQALSEEEKESDRKEAIGIWNIVSMKKNEEIK